MSNNPLRYTDPTGMEKDDIIFNAVKEDGSKVELGRIVTDKFDVTFDIDGEKIDGVFDLDNHNSVEVDGKMINNFDNAQAVSLDVSGEAAFKVGVQGQASLFGMIDGPDKGEWGIGIQANGLLGLEGGITFGFSVYEALGGQDLFLNDLQGWEYGVQGDFANMGGSYFRGKNYLLGKDTYHGFSVGASFGVLPTFGSGSGYLGYGGLMYRTKKINRP